MPEPDARNPVPVPPDVHAQPEEGLKREGMPNNPEWLMKAGMAIGVIVFLSFLVLAVIGGTKYPNLICDSYALLAATFAFGAALSGAFIGGSAAAQGQFGDKATRQSLHYSLGGGVAFFLIAFVAFKLYEDKSRCSNKEVHLKFQAVPVSLTHNFNDNNTFWTKKIFSDAKHFSLTILLRQEARHTRLSLQNGDKIECSIDIQIVKDSALPKSEHPLPFAGDSLGFEFDRKWEADFLEREEARKTGSVAAKAKEVDEACFEEALTRRPVTGRIVITPLAGRAVVQASLPGIGGLHGDPTEDTILTRSDFSLSKARAEVSKDIIPFSELKALLSHQDPNRRVAARRYLEKNFENYEKEVMAELFLPNQNPDYLAGLLHGLIAGIDSKTEGKLNPERARDLKSTLPYLNGREAEIIKLSGDPDDGVRKQARRLIQRYPVDAFDKVYLGMTRQNQNTNCSDTYDGESQAALYGGIFYYYNRIVQFAYERKWGKQERDLLDQMLKKGRDIAKCLESELKVDSASLLFARAIAYNLQKDVPGAKRYAQEFLDELERLKPAKYYARSQVDAANRIIRGA